MPAFQVFEKIIEVTLCCLIERSTLPGLWYKINAIYK